jgi:hypothetical protein
MARSFIRDPQGTLLRGLVTITLPSMAIYALNHDEPWYERLPAWQKNMFWIFSVDGGNTIYRIPKPFDWGMLFASMPERIADQFKEDDPRAFEKWVSQFGTMTVGFDPMAFAGGDFGELLGTLPLPPLVTSISAVTTGYDPFTKSAIVSPGLEGLKDSAQYTHNTSWFNRRMAEFMESIGIPSLMSPIEADYMVRANFGGLGTQTLRAVSKALKTVDPKAPENPVEFKDFADRAMLLSAFNVDEYSANSRYSTDFYDALRQLSEAERTLAHFQRIGDLDAIRENIDLVPAAMVSKAMRQSAEQAKGITAAIKILEYDDRLDPETRRAKRRSLVMTRDRLYQTSLAGYRKMMQAVEELE